MKNRIYPNLELIHHSDKGLQYCSDNYQNMLSKYKIKWSMTEQYTPYQNAIAERINGIMKQEFLMNTKDLDIKTMGKIIKESVNIYNSERPHLSCNLLTKNEMHKQNVIERKTYKVKTIQMVFITLFH